jgi:hypothetical protein
MPPGTTPPSAESLEKLHDYFTSLSTKLDLKNNVKDGQMSYNMADKRELSHLYIKNLFICSKLGKEQMTSSSPHAVGAFVATLGQSMFSEFAEDMRKQLQKKVKVSAKTNVLRIAQKIEQIMEERNITAAEAWPYLTDILRLQVFCDTPDEVFELFKTKIMPRDENLMSFKIMRYKVRFSGYL